MVEYIIQNSAPLAYNALVEYTKGNAQSPFADFRGWLERSGRAFLKARGVSCLLFREALCPKPFSYEIHGLGNRFLSSGGYFASPGTAKLEAVLHGIQILDNILKAQSHPNLSDNLHLDRSNLIVKRQAPQVGKMEPVFD